MLRVFATACCRVRRGARVSALVAIVVVVVGKNSKQFTPNLGKGLAPRGRDAYRLRFIAFQSNEATVTFFSSSAWQRLPRDDFRVSSPRDCASLRPPPWLAPWRSKPQGEQRHAQAWLASGKPRFIVEESSPERQLLIFMCSVWRGRLFEERHAMTFRACGLGGGLPLYSPLERSAWR